jgi:acetoin utilization deacetylase AcuC-like enzyme
MVEDEPDLFFASTHEWPFYPGTGAREERGNHDNVVNVPLAAFTGSAEFRRGMVDFILPAVEAFAPDLLMISAGFDAHRRDPLAHINLEAGDFAWATRELMVVARRHCDGRIVSVLEGGYSMDGLAESLAAHVRELMAA